MRKAINDIKDVECTCECGNKHQLYGGTGYTLILCEGYSDGQIDGGYYRAEYRCNNCNTIKIIQC